MNNENRKRIKKEEAYLNQIVKELETELGTKRRRRINPLWILLLVLVVVGLVISRMPG